MVTKVTFVHRRLKFKKYHIAESRLKPFLQIICLQTYTGETYIILL